MIDLNFLPSSEYALTRKKIMLAVLKYVLIRLNLIFIVVGLLLLWSKFFLEGNLAQWHEQSILVSQTRLDLADQATALNKKVQHIHEIQSNFVIWSDVIAEITGYVPANTRIQELILDTNDNYFAIRGLSSTRDELLVFERKLNESVFINEVESPLSNLLKPRDIDFEFQGSLTITE